MNLDALDLMPPKIIKNGTDHALALHEVGRLMKLDPPLGSAESDRLALFAMLIEQYEKARFPIAEPTAEEAAAFRADQERRK